MKKDAARTPDRMHCLQMSGKIVKAKVDVPSRCTVRNLKKFGEPSPSRGLVEEL